MDIAFKMLTLENVFKYYMLAVLCSELGILHIAYSISIISIYTFYFGQINLLVRVSLYVGVSSGTLKACLSFVFLTPRL